MFVFVCQNGFCANCDLFISKNKANLKYFESRIAWILNCVNGLELCDDRCILRTPQE
jgi:hypothetical protein